MNVHLCLKDTCIPTCVENKYDKKHCHQIQQDVCRKSNKYFSLWNIELTIGRLLHIMQSSNTV